jgi:hypothetical protein
MKWDEKPRLLTPERQPLSYADLQELAVGNHPMLPFHQSPNRSRRFPVPHGSTHPTRTAST